MSKYDRKIPGTEIEFDVYDILEAFDVRCPARQHAIKKILCAGIRGDKGIVKDLDEAVESIERAIQLENRRNS
jgi:hypothetical protein